MKKIERRDCRNSPGYPSLREHVERQVLLGAVAALGLGATVSRGEDIRLGGVPRPPGAPPAKVRPVALLGRIRAEPTSSCLATNLPAVTNSAPVDVVALPYTTYVVKSGDTLSKLAEQFLGERSRWPEIVTANPGLIPEKLRTGQTIRLPAVPK